MDKRKVLQSRIDLAECTMNDQLTIPMKRTSTDSNPDTQAHFEKIFQRLDKIETKLDAKNDAIDKILVFMSDLSEHRRDQSENIPAKKRLNENFAEFEQMGVIETAAQLMELEKNLQNSEYKAKFIRYFKSLYTLNGKREGSPFFKTIMRRLMVPTVLLSYSWKGNNRKKDNQTHAVETVSFKQSFPNFIKVIECIINAADLDYTHEDNEKVFSDFLRQKNKEIQRYVMRSNGGTVVRTSTVRRRHRRKLVTPADGQREQLEANQGKPPYYEEGNAVEFSCNEESESEYGVFEDNEGNVVSYVELEEEHLLTEM